MDIGKEKRRIHVEPVTTPVPEKEPVREPEREPVQVPEREPEKVPAGLVTGGW